MENVYKKGRGLKPLPILNIMVWILALISVAFGGFDLYAIENQSVPLFKDEVIHLTVVNYSYEVVIKNHKILSIRESFSLEPTIEIYISEKGLKELEEILNKDIPETEKKDLVLKWVKNNLDKEIKIKFYGLFGIMKYLMLKLYLVIV